jgi:hypothetical protein
MRFAFQIALDIVSDNDQICRIVELVPLQEILARKPKTPPPLNPLPPGEGKAIYRTILQAFRRALGRYGDRPYEKTGSFIECAVSCSWYYCRNPCKKTRYSLSLDGRGRGRG